MQFALHLNASLYHMTHSQRLRNKEDVQNSRYKTQAHPDRFTMSNKADNSKCFSTMTLTTLYGYTVINIYRGPVIYGVKGSVPVLV